MPVFLVPCKKSSAKNPTLDKPLFTRYQKNSLKFIKDQKKANIAKAVDNLFMVKYVHR